MIWIGHAVHLFQLTPCCLSALNAVYRFVREAEGRRLPVWPAVRFELRLVLGLLMLSEVNLASEFSPEVYMGDSANNGYALLSTRATPVELREACTFKERWRFAAVPVDSVPSLISPAEYDIAGGLSPLGGENPAAPNLRPADLRIRPGVPAGCGPTTAFGRCGD